MVPAPKSVLAIYPQTVSAAGTVAGNIDRLGYDYAVIDVMTNTSDAASNKPSVLKLSEGDSTSSFSDVPGLVGGATTASDFIIPSGVTATSNLASVAQFRLDLRPRKRYLGISVSPATTQIICAVAHLFRANAEPEDATKANVGVLVTL